MAENEEGLQRRISAAHESLTEIAAKRKVLRWLRIAVPVVAILLVVVGLMMLADSARTNVVERKDELSTEFQKRASQMNLAERIQREAEQTIDRVLPRLQQEIDAAQAKIVAIVPKTLETETAGMEARVKKHMNDTLNTSLDDVKKRQRDFLMKEFGEYLECKPTDSRDICSNKEKQIDALMGELTGVFRDWAVEQMTGTFNAHLKTLADIHTTVAAFSKKGAESGDAASKSVASGTAPADMLRLFVEAAADALGGGESAFGDGGPQIIETGAGDHMAEEGIIVPVAPANGGAPTEGGAPPAPAEGAAPAPAEGAAPAPAEGAAPAPAEGAAPAPAEGAAPAPAEGAAPAPAEGAAPAPAQPEAPKAP